MKFKPLRSLGLSLLLLGILGMITSTIKESLMIDVSADVNTVGVICFLAGAIVSMFEMED